MIIVLRDLCIWCKLMMVFWKIKCYFKDKSNFMSPYPTTSGALQWVLLCFDKFSCENFDLLRSSLFSVDTAKEESCLILLLMDDIKAKTLFFYWQYSPLKTLRHSCVERTAQNSTVRRRNVNQIDSRQLCFIHYLKNSSSADHALRKCTWPV